MKKALLFASFGCLVIFGSGCKSSDNDNLQNPNHQELTPKETNVFSDKIAEVIDSTIVEYLTIIENDSCVYILLFMMEDDTCIFEMITSNYVPSKDLAGMTYFNDHLMACYFLNESESCWSDHVNKSGLFIEVPSETLDENFPNRPAQDPYRWKYSMWGDAESTSFRLIKKGFF